MKLTCVWEHNGGDTLLWADNLPGLCARGASLEEAKRKLPGEARRFLLWQGKEPPSDFTVDVVQEEPSQGDIRDADSFVIFQSERPPLPLEEYRELKALVLRSAGDFETLYQAVPDKEAASLPPRRTFYGQVPRTAREMYVHTRNVNDYYFGEIGVDADNEGSILACRERAFVLLEQRPGFLENQVYAGSWDEEWSLRKVLRRFLWHDRIHAKAMARMGARVFGPSALPDVFRFTAQ